MSSSERVRERDRDEERERGGAGISGEKQKAYERKITGNLPYGMLAGVTATQESRLSCLSSLLCLR